MASGYVCLDHSGNNRGSNKPNVFGFLYVKSPARTGLRGAGSLGTSRCVWRQPTATLKLDNFSLADLPTIRNLYGFTGMQGLADYGNGNL